MAAAQEQRTEVQDVVTTLSAQVASRGDELAQIEQRIQSLQQSGGGAARAQAAGLAPGQYTVGPVTATFAPDGTFQMSGSDKVRNVTGRYALEGGQLVLSEAEGDVGTARFPMTCAIADNEGGFALEDEDGSCGLFAGRSFERVR